MTDIEDLKRRKMEELEEQMGAQTQEELQLQQQIQQLEQVVKAKMTKEAIERFGNVRIAFPEKAIQALVVLAQLIQTEQISQVDDAYLRETLKKLTPEKKDFKVKRK